MSYFGSGLSFETGLVGSSRIRRSAISTNSDIVQPLHAASLFSRFISVSSKFSVVFMWPPIFMMPYFAG